MFRDIFRLAKIAHYSCNQQKRSFLKIVNQVHLKPGLCSSIPIIHDVQKVDMREAVKSVYKTCCDVSNYRSAIHSVGTSSLRSIVRQFEYDQIIDDRNRLNKEWLLVIGDSIEHCGIQTTKAEIQSFGLLDASVTRTLEKQIDAEPDADLVTAQKQTEGQKYMIEQETLALTQQLESITKQLNNDHYLAVQYLLARRRFDELQATANGRNNSTYFINNQTKRVHSLKIFSDLEKRDQ
ncbi:unnamed protein product [Rotaria sp. Silwood1]|nr:unnamed protein product [Rotaria sp. Silwood1]